MRKEVKSMISKLRAYFGYNIAKELLIEQGISNSLAQKLLADTYPNEPTTLVIKAIEAAFKGVHE